MKKVQKITESKKIIELIIELKYIKHQTLLTKEESDVLEEEVNPVIKNIYILKW